MTYFQSRLDVSMAKHQATVTPIVLCGGSGTRLWPL